MWRTLTRLGLASVAGAMVAVAASLALSSGTLGTATAAIPRCTTAGLGVVQNLAAGTVVSVTVSGIPAACGGALLQASVNNGVTSGSGSTAVPAAGGTVTVNLGLPPAVTAVEQTDLVLVGP